MVTKELILFGAVLYHLDLAPSQLNTQIGRLHTHKLFYLLQEAGLNLGYRFDSNLWGPISEEVSQLMWDFQFHSYAQHLADGLKIKPEYQLYFEKVQRLREYPGYLTPPSSDWISMVAGVCWYTRTHTLVKFDLPQDHPEVLAVKERVVKHIPGYPKITDNFPTIWNRLQQVYGQAETSEKV